MNYETHKSTPRLSIKALLLVVPLRSGASRWRVCRPPPSFASSARDSLPASIPLTASIDHATSSPMLIGSWLMVGGVLAPLVGGYPAAKIAPDGKLLHGVLSTSLWLIFAVCCDIWGPDNADVPHWLDMISSYWVPVRPSPGYLCQWRAMRPAVVAQA